MYCAMTDFQMKGKDKLKLAHLEGERGLAGSWINQPPSDGDSTMHNQEYRYSCYDRYSIPMLKSPVQCPFCEKTITLEQHFPACSKLLYMRTQMHNGVNKRFYDWC